MKDDETASLDHIGHLLRKDRTYPSEDTLLYADVDGDAVGTSVPKDLGDRILFRRSNSDRLYEALLHLWHTQTGNHKWAEMEYVLRSSKFEATYIYRDEIDPDERYLDRRDRSVRRHFGDKTILYPPWIANDDDLGEEL